MGLLLVIFRALDVDVYVGDVLVLWLDGLGGYGMRMVGMGRSCNGYGMGICIFSSLLPIVNMICLVLYGSYK